MSSIIQTAEEARIQYFKERNLWSEKNDQYLSEVNKAIQQANKEGIRKVVIDVPDIINTHFLLSLLRHLDYQAELSFTSMRKVIIEW